MRILLIFHHVYKLDLKDICLEVLSPNLPNNDNEKVLSKYKYIALDSGIPNYRHMLRKFRRQNSSHYSYYSILSKKSLLMRSGISEPKSIPSHGIYLNKEEQGLKECLFKLIR